MKSNLPRIIFAVTNDLSYDQRMIRIASTLASNGYQVFLVGREKKESIPLKKHNFQQIRLQLWFSKGKLFYLEYNLRLFFFLLKTKCDLIGSIDLDTLLPCYIVSILKRKPCVFDAHEYFTEVPEVVNRPITKFIWKSIGDRIIPRLKYAYTVSASLQDLFSEKYNIPFDLIRNIAATTTHTNKESAIISKQKDKAILFYQGVLNEGRGLEAMIAVMPFLEEVELWLAGEGDLSESLRQLVIDLRVVDKVKFLGYLSPLDLKTVTKQATIGLNLLENKGLSYYYSLANKTFDYIQAEVPAIHINFPEYQILNEHLEIGILVKDLEKMSLLVAINLLLKDKALYQKLKENCQKAKQIYNWETESKKLLAIYQEILKM